MAGIKFCYTAFWGITSVFRLYHTFKEQHLCSCSFGSLFTNEALTLQSAESQVSSECSTTFRSGTETPAPSSASSSARLHSAFCGITSVFRLYHTFQEQHLCSCSFGSLFTNEALTLQSAESQVSSECSNSDPASSEYSGFIQIGTYKCLQSISTSHEHRGTCSQVPSHYRIFTPSSTRSHTR